MFTAKARSKPETKAPWEQFCKDEARRAAHVFLEKVRRLQTEDRSSMEVPETVFATKFSAHFMDEVMDLAGGGVPNGGLHSSADFSSRGKKAVAGKSWWNIFKRRQSRDDRGAIISASSSAYKNASNRGLNFEHGLGGGDSAGHAVTVLEAQVKMLDMGETSLERGLTWQACRLVLTSKQGNHQLEIYSPPKSNLPKMTLFCFLLKEVRSSTSLELPDSVSSFVVKSDHHAEYVFDAGSETEKDKWIATIRSHSSHLCHQYSAPNGHLANKARSHTVSVMEQNRLQRQRHNNHALLSFPIVPQPPPPPPPNSAPRRLDSMERDSIHPTAKSFSSSPSPCRSSSLRRQNRNSSSCTTPATPDRETTPTFFRCRPQRTSPDPRPRRTLSMYEHGGLIRPSYPAHHSHSNSNSSSQTPPSPSPPLPKRSQRSLSSLNEIAKATTTHHPASFSSDTVKQRSWPNGSNPAIVTSSSSPNGGGGIDNPFSSSSSHHTGGNLDNCSQNSSSSALHPVTLAAGTQQQQRTKARNSSVSSLNASPTTAPRQAGGSNGRSQLSPASSRKMSTTSGTSPSGSTNWAHDIEEEVRRAKQRFPSCDGLSDTDGFPAFLDTGSNSAGDSQKTKHEGSPSPPFASSGGGYPPSGILRSPAASPSVLRRFSPTLNSYMEEMDSRNGGSGGGHDSEVMEVFPSSSREPDLSGGSGNSAGGATCMSPSPVHVHPKPRKMRFFSDTQVDSIHPDPPHTLRTPSPSSSSGGAGGILGTTTFDARQPPEVETNGIFIELDNPRFPPGVPSHTTHPYASWAVTQQDATNLREMAKYPWFHGMISRANATQLVLTEGEAGSGRYLVRQSESREGEFVLTFNYKGRAKHLRIVLDSTGCSVQHLFFNNVSNMLDYFKQNTIPLETCWNEDDCRITDFIDRSVSDPFRIITAIYNNDLLSSPRVPRRSHSLHLALTQAVMSAMQQGPSGGSPVTGGRAGGRRGSSSLPQSAQPSGGGGGGGWRQLFRQNRAGMLQRRHSEMSDMHHAIDNNYTLRT